MGIKRTVDSGREDSLGRKIKESGKSAAGKGNADSRAAQLGAAGPASPYSSTAPQSDFAAAADWQTTSSREATSIVENPRKHSVDTAYGAASNHTLDKTVAKRVASDPDNPLCINAALNPASSPGASGALAKELYAGAQPKVERHMSSMDGGADRVRDLLSSGMMNSNQSFSVAAGLAQQRESDYGVHTDQNINNAGRFPELDKCTSGFLLNPDVHSEGKILLLAQMGRETEESTEGDKFNHSERNNNLVNVVYDEAEDNGDDELMGNIDQYYFGK